jgi:hypothetical protein
MYFFIIYLCLVYNLIFIYMHVIFGDLFFIRFLKII